MGKVSPETRSKLSEIRRNWWRNLTEQEREAYAEKQRGKKHPKASAALKGKPKSPEHIAKLQTGEYVPCENCTKPVYRTPFQLRKFKHAFCSRECSSAWAIDQRQKNRNKERCLQCGKEFNRVPSREKHNHGNHFCSKTCASAHRTGENSDRWQGGRHKRKDGYIDLAASLVPEGYKSMVRNQNKVLEHRLVMAMHLERPLEAWEVVHHINSIRDDNRIENLELHSAMAHNGITAATNKEIASLKRQITRLQNKLKKLEG